MTIVESETIPQPTTELSSSAVVDHHPLHQSLLERATSKIKLALSLGAVSIWIAGGGLAFAGYLAHNNEMAVIGIGLGTTILLISVAAALRENRPGRII